MVICTFQKMWKPPQTLVFVWESWIFDFSTQNLDSPTQFWQQYWGSKSKSVALRLFYSYFVSLPFPFWNAFTSWSVHSTPRSPHPGPLWFPQIVPTDPRFLACRPAAADSKATGRIGLRAAELRFLRYVPLILPLTRFFSIISLFLCWIVYFSLMCKMHFHHCT